jgi:hypothetical protein
MKIRKYSNYHSESLLRFDCNPEEFKGILIRKLTYLILNHTVMCRPV